MVIIGDHIMIGTTIKSFNEWNTHAQVALNSRAQDYFKDLQSDQITALDTNISFFQNYKKTIQSFCKKSYRNRCDMINKTSLCHESDVDLDSIFH
jgi:hypothetical protein